MARLLVKLDDEFTLEIFEARDRSCRGTLGGLLVPHSGRSGGVHASVAPRDGLGAIAASIKSS